MEELTGSIEKLTYYDEESHFAVATLKSSRFPRPVAIIGTLPAIQVGETIHCSGSWKQHTKYGAQFEVEVFRLELPTDAASIEKFLGSGAVKGIGPAYAKKIVEKFGSKTLETLEKNHQALFAIEGIGKKRIQGLIDAWNNHTSFQELFLFLHHYGISRTYSKKIIKRWGNYALQKLKANPWLLAQEVRGIGFRTADQIAHNLGLASDAPERIVAGIDFLLFELSQDGHVCFPAQEFIEKAKILLGVTAELIDQGIEKLLLEKKIEVRKVKEMLMVWAKTLFACEVGIAQEMKRLMRSPPHLRKVDAEKALVWAEERLTIRFAPLQKEAVTKALLHKLSIITGGPGTGKSTITRAIISIFSKLTRKILLAAPTGRAAKRLSEITHMHASTIHRILKFDFTKGAFKHNRELPLDCDIVIIDEVSMIDTYLMFQLLRAIPNHAKVVIIGDANQLPSVGPGNVLRDLIASQTIPMTELTTIFRQAQGSQIIVNAHRINQGMMPFTTSSRRSDFFFMEAKEPQEVQKIIIDLACKKVPAMFNYDPKREIQVLSPMRKGICGIEALNQSLQQILTPDSGSRQFFFRVHDKVMQLKNNYSKDVFNGDIGHITKIDYEEGRLAVRIDEREVEYDFSELDELTLAYAVSIHKFQGCECPCIIMPVHTSHFKLLTRNLLYTGLTRGKKLVFFVGTKQALAIGVKNQEVDNRYTGLKQALNDDGAAWLPEMVEKDLFSAL